MHALLQLASNVFDKSKYNAYNITQKISVCNCGCGFA